MKMNRLMLMAVLSIVVLSPACARYHHGRPMETRGPSMSEVVPRVNQLVEQHVKDPDKAKQVQTMIREIVGDVRRMSQETRGFHEQLNTLNAQYDTKREQFMKVLDEMNEARMASSKKILEKRFQIKELLSPEEWKNLNDAMVKVRREYSPRTSD
jgi:uncharacterized coiled-coil DUF342 family protein